MVVQSPKHRSARQALRWAWPWGVGSRVLREERNYILQMVKKIKAAGVNVLLIQKSILRDATTDLSLHYLVCWMCLRLSLPLQVCVHMLRAV